MRTEAAVAWIIYSLLRDEKTPKKFKDEMKDHFRSAMGLNANFWEQTNKSGLEA